MVKRFQAVSGSTFNCLAVSMSLCALRGKSSGMWLMGRTKGKMKWKKESMKKSKTVREQHSQSFCQNFDENRTNGVLIMWGRNG